MIEQTRIQALMKPDLSNEIIKKTQDIAPVFVDTKTANILHLMGGQTNPQIKLNLLDLPNRSYKMNDVEITLEQGSFLVKDKIYEFQMVLLTFLLNQMQHMMIKLRKMKTKLKSF